MNGVGKSTNLAKVAYWLVNNNVKILIAACDTFRSGAVEQLRTHCKRLKAPLFEMGYDADSRGAAFSLFLLLFQKRKKEKKEQLEKE